MCQQIKITQTILFSYTYINKNKKLPKKRRNKQITLLIIIAALEILRIRTIFLIFFLLNPPISSTAALTVSIIPESD